MLFTISKENYQIERLIVIGCNFIYHYYFFSRKHATDASILALLTKGEGSGNTSKVDQFLGSPLCRNTTNIALDNSRTNHSSKTVNVYDLSNSTAEDIGECVEEQTKPCKENKTAKKRKSNLENCVNPESNVAGSIKAVKMVSGANEPPLNSPRMKPKKSLKNSSGERTGHQDKINKLVREPQDMENHCSPSFVKLYKSVKKRTRTIDSVGNLRKFLQTEKKNRQEKVKGRVSRLLKKQDWSKFTKYVKKRLEDIEGLNLDGSEAVQHMIGKTRIRVKFWLLFPHLEGRKPENWTAILGTLAA